MASGCSNVNIVGSLVVSGGELELVRVLATVYVDHSTRYRLGRFVEKDALLAILYEIFVQSQVYPWCIWVSHFSIRFL